MPNPGKGESGLRETQTLSVSTSFRHGWRMVRAGGGAGLPADMSKSSECRSDIGRFCLRRGTGFAGLDGRKDCAMPGTETGKPKSLRKSQLWWQDFTAKLFCNVEFWMERLPELIGLCEITTIAIPNSELDPFTASLPSGGKRKRLL